jgi:6-phosphogluconate dehydrogenase
MGVHTVQRQLGAAFDPRDRLAGVVRQQPELGPGVTGGLGRMGGGLALQAMEKGMRVVGMALGGASVELREAGLMQVNDAAALVAQLQSPRIVFLYIPAGPPVDQWLDTLADMLQPGDIVVDGGNSYWGDSIRRSRRLKERGIYLVDLGTSGGVDGARHGACFMAGGERKAIQHLEPILLALSVEGGYVHAGAPGAGHFTKLVHNGIEFGMLQAIGEGMTLLERYRDKLDIANVLGCWRHGSVIRSWLIDLMHEAYTREGGLDKISPYVEDTGEVNWLVDDALHMEVPTPVIANAVMQLLASRDEGKDWARAIGMMRHGFGGHPYGPNESIVEERRTGRVGGFVRD